MKKALSLAWLLLTLLVLLSCEEEGLLKEYGQKYLGSFYVKTTENYKIMLITNALMRNSDTNYDVENIYYHRYLSVTKEGKTMEIEDRALKILSPQLKKVYRELVYPYNNRKETLEILKAEIYPKEGKTLSIDVKRTVEKPVYSGGFYPFYREKRLFLKGIEEESVIRIIIKRTYSPKEESGFILAGNYYQNHSPIREILTLTRFEKATLLTNTGRMTQGILSNATVSNYVIENGDQVFLVLITNPPPIRLEPNAVDYRETESRWFGSSPKSWEDVGRFYYTLFSDRFESDAMMVELANELAADMTDEREKIGEILYWVRNYIRDVPIELGRYHFTPRKATEILSRGYADATDKAILLVALLKVLDIKAMIMPIQTNFLIDLDMPTPFVFNHAIVAVPVAEETLYIDPTDKKTRLGLIPQSIQNRYALQIEETNSQIILIPDDRLENNACHNEVIIEILDETNTMITAVNTMSGGFESIRETLLGLTDKIIRQSLIGKMPRPQQGLILHDNAFENLRDNHPLVQRFRYSLVNFGKVMGNISFFTPLETCQTIDETDWIGLSDRLWDMEISPPHTLVADIVVIFPSNAVVEYLPTPLILTNPAFGSYLMTISNTSNTIYLHREFSLLRRRIQTSEYADFREFYKGCYDADRSIILYRIR